LLYYRIIVLFAGERIFKSVHVCRSYRQHGRLLHMPCLPCTAMIKDADFARQLITAFSIMVLLKRDRAMPGDGGVFLRRHRAMESTPGQPAVDCFATILTASQNFLATIWPLIEILRSLVLLHTVRYGNYIIANNTPMEIVLNRKEYARHS